MLLYICTYDIARADIMHTDIQKHYVFKKSLRHNQLAATRDRAPVRVVVGCSMYVVGFGAADYYY